MSLLLAIEPDQQRASKLAALARGALNVELIMEATADQAFSALKGRVPDSILTSSLLSTKDETVLADRLRDLDAAGAHVQTLVVPVLAATTHRPSRKGLLTKLRRAPQEDSRHDGCDPLVFAAQVAEYLVRAATERSQAKEGLTEAPCPVPPVFSVTASIRHIPVLALALTEGASPAVSGHADRTFADAPAQPPLPQEPERVIVLEAVDLIPVDLEAFARELEQVELVNAPTPPSHPQVNRRLPSRADNRGRRSAASKGHVGPSAGDTGAASPQVATVAAVAEASAAGDTVRPEAAAASPSVPLTTAALHVDDGLAGPEERDHDDLWMALPAPQRFPPLEGADAQVESSATEIRSASEPTGAAHGTPTDGADVDLSRTTERSAETTRSLASQARPSPPRGKRSSRKPIQDEWGFFDPQQCGFAALLAKLDEFAELADFVAADPQDPPAAKAS